MAMRTGRVRTRAEFTTLRERGVRSRRGPVRVTFVPSDGPAGDIAAGGVRVAFAVGKPVGNAVTRNRVRRRLREAMADLGAPPGNYLVSAGPEAADLSYAALRAELGAGLADVAPAGVDPDAVAASIGAR